MKHLGVAAEQGWAHVDACLLEVCERQHFGIRLRLEVFAYQNHEVDFVRSVEVLGVTSVDLEGFHNVFGCLGCPLV